MNRFRITLLVTTTVSALVATGIYVFGVILPARAARSVVLHPPVNIAEQMNELVKASEPPGDPAWPIYHQAIREDFGVLGIAERDDHFDADLQTYLREYDATRGEWSDAHWDRARALLDRHQRVLDLMLQAAEKPRLGKPYIHGGDALSGERDPTEPEESNTVLLPEIPWFRAMGALGVYAMRDAAMHDEWGRFTELTRANIRLGEHLSRCGGLVEWRVGVGIIRLTLEELRFTLVERELPEDLSQALRAMVASDAARGLIPAIEMERLFMRAALRSVYGTNGILAMWLWGDWRDGVVSALRDPPTKRQLRENVAALEMPRLDASLRALDSHYDGMRARAEAAMNLPIGAAMQDHPFIESDNPVVAEMVGQHRVVFLELWDLRREVAAIRLMLQLEELCAVNGEWPSSLGANDLMVDPATGDPFIYVVSDDRYELMAIGLPPLLERTMYTASRPELEDDLD